MRLSDVNLGKLWVLFLIVAATLEVLALNQQRVMAQGTATPEATATPGATPTPGATATPGATPTATSTPQPTVDVATYADMVSALEEAPSGNDSESAKLYYDYIYANYLGNQNTLATGINWAGPLWILFWVVILAGFFFFYVTRFGNVHREKGELYGITSFAGSILERIGAVSFFNKVLWAAIVLWALYYIVTHILWGQIY